MRHRYIVLLAAVLAIAALAIMAGQVTGEKTVAPATQGGQGQQTQQAPQAQQTSGQQPAPAAGRGFGASAMPMASSPAVKMPAATTKPTMGPTTAATMRPGATMAPTAKVTPAATGRVGTGPGTGVAPGARVGGGAFFAQVTSYGLVTETISPGGVLTGYMVIQNNGNNVINDALINIAVTQAGAAGTAITSRDQTLSNLNIAPGDQKRVEFSVNVPNSVTPGSYDVRATVQANGQQIDTFTKTVTVS